MLTAVYNSLFPATSFLTAQDAINMLSRQADSYPVREAHLPPVARKKSLPEQRPQFDGKTGKSWSSIIDEYDFFSSHSSEAEVLSAVYARTIDHYPSASPPALLDFGCGNASFTTRVWGLLNKGPGKISLFEPIKEYHAEALRNLSTVTQGDVKIYGRFYDMGNDGFDIILANHSLYYVDDLHQNLVALISRLKERGVMIATLADPVLNPLLVLWYQAFAYIRRPIPFYIPEEILQVMGYLGLMVKINRVESRLVFPDTPMNRKMIFKFVLGQYACLFKDEYLNIFFDPYSTGKNVTMPLVDDHLIIMRMEQQ